MLFRSRNWFQYRPRRRPRGGLRRRPRDRPCQPRRHRAAGDGGRTAAPTPGRERRRPGRAPPWQDRDLEVDSLDAVEIIMEIEDEYDIEIPDEEAEKFQKVSDIVTYVEEKSN